MIQVIDGEGDPEAQKLAMDIIELLQLVDPTMAMNILLYVVSAFTRAYGVAPDKFRDGLKAYQELEASKIGQEQA